MTQEEIKAKIATAQGKLDKIAKKEAKGKTLTKKDLKDRNELNAEVAKYNLMLKQFNDPPKNGDGTGTGTGNGGENDNTGGGGSNKKPPVVNNNPNGAGGKTGGKNLQELYNESLKKQQELADQLNDANLQNKKLQEEKSALEQTQKGVDQIDEATEKNTPNVWWREAYEMAPTDKAKRGFLIANHILKNLSTGLNNISAIIANNGGSGGGKIQEFGGSLIDQYRQSKMEQVIENRRTKQNARMQFQLDTYISIGAEENRMREVQRRLRNSGFSGQYERLNSAQQAYLQGLLYEDTKGQITNAMVGNLIKQIMEGKDVSFEQVAVNSLAAAGIDNLDNIVQKGKSWGEKFINYLLGSKPGE